MERTAGKSNRRRSYPAGSSRIQEWLALSVVLLVVAALLTGVRTGPGEVHSREAQPRLVAVRGELMADEEVAIRAFNAVSASVVFIQSRQAPSGLWRSRPAQVEEDAGSGFIWDSDGYIVTNYHVVQNSETVQVTLGDQSLWKARRVGVDADKDIAVLKIDAPPQLLRPIPIGTSGDLRVGQRVFAIGNPFGYDQTLTAGIISGLGREITSASNRPIRDVIQTDAPMNPGNSGGPLLDSAGRVIGMNTAILSPTGAYAGIGFAVPIDCINRTVPEIIRGERAPKPYLAVATAPDHLVRRLGLDGVLILSVTPKTAAEKAGLRGTQRNEEGRVVLGDLILAVDGQPVGTTDDLLAAIEKHKVGDTVRLTILRGGEKIEVEVTLEALS
jgi:S1-C subfamily serine protease